MLPALLDGSGSAGLATESCSTKKALFSLFYIYVQILGMLMDEYELEGRDEFEALADNSAAFRPARPPEIGLCPASLPRASRFQLC